MIKNTVNQFNIKLLFVFWGEEISLAILIIFVRMFILNYLFYFEICVQPCLMLLLLPDFTVIVLIGFMCVLFPLPLPDSLCCTCAQALLCSLFDGLMFAL